MHTLNCEKNRFFVITGAPGSGKTALIEELKKRGYRCIEEVARQIIKEQMSIGGDALPWKNVKCFKEMILARSIETYQQAMKSAQEITFFDRDILDLIAYNRLTKTEHSEDLQNAVRMFVYNNKVFILPPWEEIYCSDNERKQTYEEAVSIYYNLRKVYLERGHSSRSFISIDERMILADVKEIGCCLIVYSTVQILTFK